MPVSVHAFIFPRSVRSVGSSFSMAKRKKIDEFLASLKSQAENEASFEKAYRAFADCMPFSDDVDLGANKNSPHAIEGWLVCKLGIEVVYRLKKISLGVTHVTECMVKDVISNLGLAGDDFLMITKVGSKIKNYQSLDLSLRKSK